MVATKLQLLLWIEQSHNYISLALESSQSTLFMCLVWQKEELVCQARRCLREHWRMVWMFNMVFKLSFRLRRWNWQQLCTSDNSAVASMRPTEALASVKFWRISPIIFILHKRSSDIFNASWYYKEFSNSVNILWKNYHIIDLKGGRTWTQIFFEQILIKTIGEVNGHPDYVACFWLLLFKFHLN